MTSELQEVLTQQSESLTSLDMSASEEELGNQYLSFKVGGEVYAVNILSVQEIRGWELPTFLPNSPSYVNGVLNLRGTIVPVIDLRIRFDFKRVDYTETTVIIILKVESGDSERLMGCVVDAVSDVFNAEESEIKQLPKYTHGVDPRFTAGVMSIEENAVTLLDLNNLLDLGLIEHPYTGESNV